MTKNFGLGFVVSFYIDNKVPCLVKRDFATIKDDVSFTHAKHMFGGGTDNNNLGVIYTYVYLSLIQTFDTSK